MLVLSTDSCSVPVKLYFLLVLEICQSDSICENEEKELEIQIYITESMHSLNCAVEKLKSILNYQITDVVTYQENLDCAIHCVFKETF